MKKRKGSLLIAVTLLSVVLLIIMMTILNLNKKNAELTTYQSDKEKAFQVANIGLQKAAEDIEIKIQKYMNKNQLETITWQDLYSKFENSIDPITVTTDKYENEDYKYQFKYANGKITSTGIYKKTKVTLTANYAMDYMGISSNGINYIDQKTPVANIKSIYSYNTQYPMMTWINTDKTNSDTTDKNLNPISLPNDNLLTSYNLLNNKDNLFSSSISNQYIIYDRMPAYNENVIHNEEAQYSTDNQENSTYNGQIETENNIDNDSLLSQMEDQMDTDTLNQIDQATENLSGNYPNTSSLISSTGRNYLKELISSVKLNSNSANNIYTSSKVINFNVSKSIRNLDLNPLQSLFLGTYSFFCKIFNKKEEEPSLDRIIRDSFSDINVNSSNLKSNVYDNNNNGIYEIESGSLKNISEEPFKYNYNDQDGKYIGGKKNIYLFQGRNVVAIPINSTLVINGDIILAPNSNDEKIETFYGFSTKNNDGEPHKHPNTTSLTDKEKNENYPVLVVTGNLVVNGVIRGTGTVFSMNSITINAMPSNDNTLIDTNKTDNKGKKIGNKYSNYYGNDNLEKGAVIIHACNQLYIMNKFSLNCLDNPKTRDNVTASWILTQNPNTLQTISDKSCDLSNGEFSTDAGEHDNTKPPTANVKLSNKLPVGVPQSDFTGTSGLPANTEKNTVMMQYTHYIEDKN